jgi:hypothetical protein
MQNFPYGDGMLVTGKQLPILVNTDCRGWRLAEYQDAGDIYGYCYQPQTFRPSFAGFTTTSSYTEPGFRKGIGEKGYGARYNWHPYLAKN